MKSLKITQSITDRQDASLGIFFKEVSKIPLISQEKEIELAKRIKEGDEKAVHELVEANLRFVVSVAKQYQGKGLPLVDLIQEGMLGLIESAYKFCPDKGFRFISYAVWWIRQSIMKALSEQCRTVRVPMNQVANSSKINKAIEKLEQEYGRKPTNDELESELGIDTNKINLAMSSVNRSVSLESPFKDEDAGCLLDVIPNTNSIDTDYELTQSDVSKEINLVLNKLSYRERDVVRMSFGLGMIPMQNEEIAIRFGIGCERVRQVRNEAIEKIKSKYSKILKSLI